LGKKKKRKDREIPCNYLAGEKSVRAVTLFNAVKPHIISLCERRTNQNSNFVVAKFALLDITCGTSPLSSHILDTFPNVSITGFDMNEKAILKCKSKFPNHSWTNSLSNTFVVDKCYDFVIHIGVSSPRYNVAEIHNRLMENRSGRPKLILLEWGNNRDGTCDTKQTFDMIKESYLKSGFSLIDRGEFELDISDNLVDIPYPTRRYEILKGNF
jgi:hypothetical protein